MTETDIRNLVTQVVAQSVQGVAQSVTEQIIQATQQTGGSLAADKKVLGIEDISHDIGTDEAFKTQTANSADMWTLNKKILVASELLERNRSIDYHTALKALELKEQQLNLAEREAKLRKQATLDAIEASEREQAAFLKHAFNTLSLDFRTAAFHPISPNDGDNEE